MGYSYSEFDAMIRRYTQIPVLTKAMANCYFLYINIDPIELFSSLKQDESRYHFIGPD